MYIVRPIRIPSDPRGNLRLARGLSSGPSIVPRVSASLEGSEPTLEHVGRLRLTRGHPSTERTSGHPFTHPPYGGIKCSRLHRGTRVRRRQATTPHSGSDQGLLHQLRSLHSHSWRSGTTVGTCDVLCERARHYSSHCAANSLYFPHTFLAADPSDGMGTTLGRGPSLDQIKTPTCRTLGTLPCHAWGTYPLQEPPCRPLEQPGRRHDLRRTKDDTQDDCTPGASLSSAAQWKE